MARFNFLDAIKRRLNAGLGRVFAPINTGGTAPARNMRGFLEADKGWVYAATSAIADEVANVDLRFKQRKANGEWLDITDDNLGQKLSQFALLNNPNPMMTRFQLLKLYQKYLDLVGVAFWYVPVNGRGEPAAIYPLPPHKMKIVRSSDPKEIVAGYVYINDRGSQIPLTTKEIIFYREIDLLNPYTAGYSPARAVDVSIDSAQYSSEWNRDFFYNSAIPSGVLSTDKALTTEQFNQLANEWDQRHAGRENAHKIAVLQKGLKYEPLEVTARDADFVKLKTMTRDEILGAFRVPRTAVGITDDVNRANAEATDYVFSKRVIKPRMKALVDNLNKHWLPRFKTDGVYMFDFVDPTPQDTTSKVANATQLFDRGSLSRNELRGVIGLDELPDGDDFFMPLNYAPHDFINGESAPTDKHVHSHNHAITKKKRRIDPLRKWREQQSRIKKGTTKYKSDLAAYFVDQGKWLAKLLKKRKKEVDSSDLDALNNADWQEQQEKLEGIIEKYLPSGMLKAAEAAMKELDVEVDFSLQNPEVVMWFERYKKQEAKLITKTSKNRMAKVIEQAMKEGKGVPETAKDLMAEFENMSKKRARIIAHTEMSRAHSYAEYEVYKDAGVEQKSWHTAGVDVCPICTENEDAGKIPLTQEFPSGHQHPPAHQVCRCVLIPHIAET